MAANLDAELVRKLLALQGMSPGELSSGGDARTWAGPDGYSVTVAPGEGQWIGGDAGYYQPGAMRTRIGGNFDNKAFGVEGHDVWDDQGNFVDRSSGDSDLLSLAKMIALSAGGYYGATGLEGAMGGGAAAGEAAAGAGAGAGGMSAETAAFLEANMGAGAPMAGMPGSAYYNAVTPYLGSGAGDLAYTAGNALNGVSSGLSSVGSGAGSAGTSTLGSAASSLVNGAKDVMGTTGLNMGGLLGAAAGALSSKDQTQTTNRDPWSAAQPFLKEMLAQGSQLNQRYAQQPFSQAQQTAYGNMGSLLDAINANAGGLLGAFSNSASGANQFVRGQPQRLQGGGMNMSGFNPGLLGYMGSR